MNDQKWLEGIIQKAKDIAREGSVVPIYIPDIVEGFTSIKNLSKTSKKEIELPYVERNFKDMSPKERLSGTVDNIVSLLSPDSPILISAESGIGKTTLVKWLLKNWAIGNLLTSVKLVALFNCRAFKSHMEKSLSDFTFCFSSLKELDTDSLTYEQMKSLAKSGQLCILVDGLDECSDAIQKKDEEVRSNVRKAAKSEDSEVTGLEFIYGVLVGEIFRGSKVLCTGRQNTMHNLSNGLSSNDGKRKHKLLALLPFDSNDFQKLINEVHDSIKKNINDKLKSDRVLSELCETPFHAVKYIELFLQHGDLFKDTVINKTVLMLSLLLQGLNHRALSQDVFTKLEVCGIIGI